MTTNLKDKNLLIIVESPTKAPHVNEYLKKAGYKVTVLASYGHIMSLENGGSYCNSGIDPDKNFKLNLKIASDKYGKVEDLKRAAAKADLIYLMSDGDREGEVISWSLVKFLALPKDKYVRAVTHEITPKAVVNAIENPKQLDENLIDAGLTRLAIDKMVGFRLSPVAKTYVGAKSVGRCQSAGLKLIADREKEIQSFKPETYIDLYLNFSKNKTDFKAKYVGTISVPVDHLKSAAEVNAVKAGCTGKFIIDDIEQRIKQDSPKPPFITATFQQEAASKLGLSVKDAMSIAQKLFEAGYINYMRTDDDTFAPEFIPVLKDYIENTYGKKTFTTPRVGKKSANAQEGHECLRVIDPSLTPEDFAKKDPNNLNCKVYKIIWQRTIAAALPNAEISETTYSIINNGHRFNLVSKEIVKMGYREVYNYKDDDDKNDDGPVKETFTKGEVLQNTSLEDVTKTTKPPARYTEATFIKALQKSEIGRPSTYSNITETLLSSSRGYCELDNKSIVPTNRGMQLSSFLDRNFSSIINIDYTKEMEKDLDKIAEGKMKKLDFLKTFYNNLEAAIKQNPELSPTTQEDTPNCPICGAKMVARRSKFGRMFYGCSTYPKCSGIINIK